LITASVSASTSLTLDRMGARVRIVDAHLEEDSTREQQRKRREPYESEHGPAQHAHDIPLVQARYDERPLRIAAQLERAPASIARDYLSANETHRAVEDDGLLCGHALDVGPRGEAQHFGPKVRILRLELFPREHVVLRRSEQ